MRSAPWRSQCSNICLIIPLAGDEAVKNHQSKRPPLYHLTSSMERIGKGQSWLKSRRPLNHRWLVVGGFLVTLSQSSHMKNPWWLTGTVLDSLYFHGSLMVIAYDFPTGNEDHLKNTQSKSQLWKPTLCCARSAAPVASRNFPGSFQRLRSPGISGGVGNKWNHLRGVPPCHPIPSGKLT